MEEFFLITVLIVFFIACLIQLVVPFLLMGGKLFVVIRSGKKGQIYTTPLFIIGWSMVLFCLAIRITIQILLKLDVDWFGFVVYFCWSCCALVSNIIERRNNIFLMCDIMAGKSIKR